MKKLVVFSGAGMSAESGISTFRDSNGLWENYRIEDVATPEAWQRHPEIVQRFYNERRKTIINAEPNIAHQYIAKLEQDYNVQSLHKILMIYMNVQAQAKFYIYMAIFV
jgi:NAD-dependent deacetylase